MEPYISTAMFSRMGLGADTSNLSDGEVKNLLRSATAMVNRWCNKPYDYDFRGGTVADEEHVWDIGNDHVPRQPVIYPRRKPLRELNAFQIRVTSGQYVVVGTQYTVYDKSRNQLQAVGMATAGPSIWTASAIPAIALTKPLAYISYDYGYRFSAIEEPLQYLGVDASNNYQIWQGANEFWDATFEDGAWDFTLVGHQGEVPADSFTVDADAGTIRLDPDYGQPNTAPVLASYTYKLPWEVAQATAIVATDLIGARGIVEAGLLGLSGIKAEEIELRQSRDTRIAAGEISDRAKALLINYQDIFWGG